MFGSQVYGQSWFGAGPAGAVALTPIIPPSVGYPPVRVRRVTGDQSGVTVMAGSGTLRSVTNRFGSLKEPTVRREEGSQ